MVLFNLSARVVIELTFQKERIVYSSANCKGGEQLQRGWLVCLKSFFLLF